MFFLAPGQGSDVISDFADGEDRLALGSGLSFAQLAISAGDNGTAISVQSSGEVLAILTGIGVNQIGQEDFTFSGLKLRVTPIGLKPTVTLLSQF